MKSKLSPAELFFGHRLTSNLPIIHQSNPELVAKHQPIIEPSRTRTREVNFESGDSVWVWLSPIDNTWKQGIVIHSVVGVPDSFVVEINSQQYRRNKRDITFSPPKDNDGAVGGVCGNQHAEEQVGTENKTDRLRPRPTLKFQKIPIQTLKCNPKIYMFVQVAHYAILMYCDSWQLATPSSV